MHPFLNITIVLSSMLLGLASGVASSASAQAAPDPSTPPSAKTRARGQPRRVRAAKPARPYLAPTGSAKVAAPVSAFEGRNVSAIDVMGLKRIEKDAVTAKMLTKVGQTVRADTLRNDVQALFAMGYFEDIEISADDAGADARLIVTLRERPVIADVTFVGNERISTSDLEGVIKVKQWSILDLNRVKEDLALLQKHYEDKGFYLAKVNYELSLSDKSDEVHLRYRVNDYEKVQIKRITFLNNRAFSDDQLKATLGETREGGFFSFMSGSGNFKESGFKTDLQRLTYWYLDQGYVKFKYESPIITISDDKKWLYVTIYVDEGAKYQIGNIDFSGDLLFGREELAQEVQNKTGQTFSFSRRNADIQRLQERYQDLGYAFVNVVPKMDIQDESKTVNIDYSFEKGSLAYFGEIRIIGNTKTHDKVIRRELKIREGELYNGTRLRQSRENVERLGFFQPGEVLFNTNSPKGRNDIVDLEIQVKERPTGQITLGAGYGSAKGLFFTTTIAESNFLGKGQNLSLATNLTRDRQDKSINVGFTDPYAFDTLWSAGGDAYYTTFRIPDKYTTRRLGADARLGYPIAEYTNAYITYKHEGMKIENVAIPANVNRPDEIAADQAEIDADTGTLSSAIWSIVRDKRNNRFETTGGSYQSISFESAVFGGDKRYLKWILNNRFYTRIVGDLVFRNMLEFGQANGIEGRVVPPSERFYLGGPNNLKGFQFYEVGPQRTKTSPDGNTVYRVPVGGRTELLALLELEYPIIREAGLKFVAFYDVGNVFSGFPNLDELTLRRDYGFGFRWFSPIGPLRFEWGFPVKPRPGEDNSVFQFFIGPPF